MSGAAVAVTPLGRGMFRLEHDGRGDVVYVTGQGADRWVFWNGHVFRGEAAAPASVRPPREGPTATLRSPMPGRVIDVPARAGAQVEKGDMLVVLEAMKMELPVRAPEAATVRAVHCRPGDLVEADAPLVELS